MDKYTVFTKDGRYEVEAANIVPGGENLIYLNDEDNKIVGCFPLQEIYGLVKKDLWTDG